MLDAKPSFFCRLATRLPFALAFLAATPAFAGGTPATGAISDQLLMITGSESKTDDGDYLTARDGLATTHRYFVEVPATATRFRLDLFDMDLLFGGTADRTGDRDRPRAYVAFNPDDLSTYSSEVFMSEVEYRLFDPDGNAVVTKRRKGSRWAPSGADNAWVTFYDSNTADTTGATDTWRDNFGTSAFNNNNGSQNFTTSWIESNETGTNSMAGPGGGLVSVNVGTPLGVLRMNNLLTPFPPYTGRQPGVERELNLSGYTSATLSFTFAVPSNNEKDDILVVEASADGGTTWTTIDDVNGGIHGIAVAATARTYDITEFISANTRIRFRLAYLFAGASEKVEIDNFEIRATTAAPAALKTGHWELRVDMSKALTFNTAVQNGDETNAYGIRASDGDTTSGGREFNVYAYINTSGLDDNDRTRSYVDYPLVTSGCDFDAANFDWDADLAANVAADPDINPPFGTFKLTGRETGYTHTLATLSNNNAWYSENVTNFTSRDDATNYGIWKSEFRIDDPGDGNYVPHYYMDYDAATITPPGSNAPADALRTYFPNDAGGAPAKPYLKQFVRFKDPQPTPSANPPLVGQTARYVIYLQVVNPSGSTGSIVFNATRTVTSRFPGGTLTYRGVAIVTQGSIVSQPAIGSTTAGDVVWNLGTLTAGSGGVDNVAQLSYEVDLTPTVAPYSVNFVGAPGSGNGTRATWLDETGYDVVGSRSIFSTGELCQLFVVQDNVTPVLVSSFRGYRQDGRTVVEWQTAAEAKTTSFDVLRAAGKNAVRVNAGVLSALIASPQGGTYRLLDPDVPVGTPADYYLVAHDADGVGTTYGPYRVLAQEPLPGRPLAGSYSATVHEPSQRHLNYQPPAPPAALAGAERGGPALALETTERGLYRVARATLQSAFGLSAGQLDAYLIGAKFELSRAGEAVAWTPAPGNAGLDFFAPGFENAFTGTDVFQLELGNGVQMRKIEGKPLPLDWSGGSFRDVRHAEQNLRPVVLLPLDPQGDFFFWDFVRHGTAAETRSFAFDLPAPVAGGAAARLQLDLQGGAAGSHQLELSLNGTPIGVAAVAGTGSARASLDVPAALLLPGANSLNVRSAAGDLVFVDGFDLEYDRAYRAENDRLISRPDGKNLLAAANFSRPDARVFDLADPLAPRIVYTTRTLAEGSVYRLLWRPLGDNDQLAVGESGVRTPTVRADAASDLHDAGNQAQYLVLTTAALAAAAQELADLRADRGLSTQVVDLQDVYDEFAFGRRDPRAIRDFLAYARANWALPPRYVVLAGHGTYDYRDFLGYHNNLIPALMWNAGDSLYPTDALYADLEGDDAVPEIALGRLPVLDAGELSAYVAKLAAYEAQVPASWQSEVYLLSDVSGAGGDFLADSRALEPLLPAGYASHEIALDDLDVAAARAQLFAALGNGAALVHYSGHGAVDRLSSSSLLTNDDVAGLPNAGKPTILTASTCHVGFHALPTFDSLGEELLLHPTGGAAAVFAPTWLSENYDAAYLGDRLFRQLFAGPDVVLGDAVKAALAAGAVQSVGRNLLYAYQLLGDPALLFVAHPQPPPPPGCTVDCGHG